MIRYLLIVITIILIKNTYIINNNDFNNNKQILISINSNCNEFAYNITNNYELFNLINNYNNNYDNYINKIDIKNNSNINEIIKYNKIRLNCINKKEQKIIDDLFITYMVLLGLLLIPCI